MQMIIGAAVAGSSGLLVVSYLLAGDMGGVLVWLPITALGIAFMGWGRISAAKSRTELPGRETAQLSPEDSDPS